MKKDSFRFVRACSFGMLFVCTVLGLRADVVLHPPDIEAKKPHSSSSSIHASSAPLSVVSSTFTKPEPILLLDAPNPAFRVGEKLHFVIKYQFISAGVATMFVNEGLLINGRETMHLESKAESNNFIDKFFKVRDVNSSTIDKRSLVSLVFHQNLKEGHYHVMRNTTLDYPKRTYFFEKFRKEKITQETGPIDQPLHDILSAFFYTRTLPLEPGKEYAITVFSDKDIYALIVKVFPKVEAVTVAAGTFECLRVEPSLVGDAIFRTKDGKMTIWMTNDEKKLPVLLRSKVFIGAVDAELEKYELGK